MQNIIEVEKNEAMKLISSVQLGSLKEITIQSNLNQLIEHKAEKRVSDIIWISFWSISSLPPI